ncbi:carbohydrate ABC transporter permease [Paenibacillus aceris]|uniref:ABC-type glycerol-3-phosphate transport system permease component n=1 Tax=Paenibacillus aceris TaxID=869555 RepID=A0ABS4I3F2_9BACL|nr:carbohydrate ABC transporter permease [Paenibacillus aceris]MBP1964956.1 ABC-type glycerol-3-phosphate transport system permease component [Paenibacillus aceris]NHW35617.1 carbohydrate ABC transporter permease [Paenibacillus aceris]
MNIDKNLTARIWVPRIIVLLITFLTVFPLLFVFMTSLKSTQEFLFNIWALPSKFSLSNYSKAWSQGEIGHFFLNSFYVVSLSIAGILLFSSLAGYSLARLRVPKAEFIMMVILVPTMFPSESILMPFYIMMSKLKLLGEAYTLIVPFIGWGVPTATYIFRNFFLSIPNELLEAAKVDGASDTLVFGKVIMPIMIPTLLTVAILNFGLWGELLWTTVSMSASTFRTIPLGILAFQTQMGTDWGPLSAAICIVMVPLIILFLSSQKHFVQGLTGGAVKG